MVFLPLKHPFQAVISACPLPQTMRNNAQQCARSINFILRIIARYGMFHFKNTFNKNYSDFIMRL